MVVPMPDMHMEPDDPPVLHSKGGVAVASEYSSRRMNLLAQLDASQCCEGQYGSDIWGYTDASSGREYALMTYMTGMAMVDITTPSAPVIVGRISSPSSAWKDVKTYQHFAYLVTEATGNDIVIADLSGGTMTVVGRVTGSYGTTSTHNVVIDEARYRL